MNCLIVDDEPLARKGLREYVDEIPFLKLVGEAESAIKASAILQNQHIDLMLLDIQMPKMTGLELLRTVKAPPLVIITSAYTEYALEGFELDVLDYLVKPISFERFLKAVNKAKEYADYRAQPRDADFFFVKCNQKFEKVRFEEVLYCEALQNYSVIHLPKRKLITYVTFSGLESQLPSDQFLKTHKSYIVSVSKVTAVEGNEIFVGERSIPISRSLKEVVMRKIVDQNLLKR